MALPVWRQLRTELHPEGLEIVTVALDLEVDAARSWIERSSAEHPQLVDTAHKLDEMLGILNVPTALWVDEDGMIVRPPHTAAVERYDFSKLQAPEGHPTTSKLTSGTCSSSSSASRASTPTTTWRRYATGSGTERAAGTRSRRRTCSGGRRRVHVRSRRRRPSSTSGSISITPGTSRT